MKYSTLILAVILVFATSGCKKESLSADKDGNMISELSGVEHIVNVNKSTYIRVVTQPLDRPNNDSPYSEGVITYQENGNVIASIDFGEAGTDKARYTGKGGNKDVDLKIDENDNNKFFYKKVIVEPLVKSEDCKYIVGGIIKLYEIKTRKWVATFDYGDGTCDEFIVKTTANGSNVFSMNDYPDWN